MPNDAQLLVVGDAANSADSTNDLHGCPVADVVSGGRLDGRALEDRLALRKDGRGHYRAGGDFVGVLVLVGLAADRFLEAAHPGSQGAAQFGQTLGSEY